MGLAIGSSSFAFAAFTLAAHYAGKPPSSLTVVSVGICLSGAALRCMVRRAVVEGCALECCREQCPSARLRKARKRHAQARNRPTPGLQLQGSFPIDNVDTSPTLAEFSYRTLVEGCRGATSYGGSGGFWRCVLWCTLVAVSWMPSRLCSQPSRRFLFSTRWRLFIDPIQECALRHSRSAYGVVT